jgi:hypothetical protein
MIDEAGVPPPFARRRVVELLDRVRAWFGLGVRALFRLLVRSIARAICSCSSAIFVKPCSRKRFALARCHFADFSSPGFSGLCSIDIGCPLEQVAQLSSAIRDMVWHSAWDIERRVASQPAQLRTSWICSTAC